jgi:hypothetical protein
MEYKDLYCFCVQCQDSSAIDLSCEQVPYYQIYIGQSFLKCSCPLLIDCEPYQHSHGR